ncbi:SMI1/KNR4 family protein [Kitasatospora sp. NPDC096147]|uniref:SMI1/KNR4 family protein n=1 Tax=Kitasatospora sp. NPDC096147 TaxID=3364093 RepID=UPI00380E3F34
MDIWDEDAIRGRLAEWAEQDPELGRFGAGTHRYALRPRLAEDEVRAFERAHGIALPADYRSFVTEVGDGPAGPGHGLMPLLSPRPEAVGLPEWDQWAVDGEWSDDRRPGRLAAPFPLAGPLRGRIDAIDPPTAGTLLLAEEGCGVYLRMVLNGPCAGEVWRLDTDWAGFVPVHPDFRSWYANWLSTDRN